MSTHISDDSNVLQGINSNSWKYQETIEPHWRFVVVGENDVRKIKKYPGITVRHGADFAKTVEAPVISDFDVLIQQTRAQTKNAAWYGLIISGAPQQDTGQNPYIFQEDFASQ